MKYKIMKNKIRSILAMGLFWVTCYLAIALAFEYFFKINYYITIPIIIIGQLLNKIEVEFYTKNK